MHVSSSCCYLLLLFLFFQFSSLRCFLLILTVFVFVAILLFYLLSLRLIRVFQTYNEWHSTATGASFSLGYFIFYIFFVLFFLWFFFIIIFLLVFFFLSFSCFSPAVFFRLLLIVIPLTDVSRRSWGFVCLWSHCNCFY